MSRERDIYIAIMVACDRGVGLRLTAREVFELAGDDAIETRALNMISQEEYDAMFEGVREKDWCDLDPYAKREPCDMMARDK